MRSNTIKGSLGMRGRIEMVEMDLDGNITDYYATHNAISAKMREGVARMLVGQSGYTPSHIAVGDSAVDSYDFDDAIGTADFDLTEDIWMANQFEVADALTVDRVRLKMRRVGFSNATLTIEIQTDNSGEPSGTVVANGTSMPVAMNSLTTDTIGAIQEFNFNSPVTLASGTYWFVIKPSNYPFVNGSVEIQVFIDGFSASEDTMYSWDGSSWDKTILGGDSAMGYSVGATFDPTRTAMFNEKARNEISGASNPQPYTARFTSLFGPTEAVGLISELGLMDAGVGGNMLAYAEVNKIKSSNRVLMVIWTIEVVEVESDE